MAMAIKGFRQDEVVRIILARPAIEGEAPDFFPGICRVK